MMKLFLSMMFLVVVFTVAVRPANAAWCWDARGYYVHCYGGDGWRWHRDREWWGHHRDWRDDRGHEWNGRREHRW
jgi:hypothetical protein